MSLQRRVYLPRSTIDYAAIRGVYEFAEANKPAFGRALEVMLLESKSFNESIDSLASGSTWFQNDIDDFKAAACSCSK